MKNKICIVGLGYVGLPLLWAFSSKFKVIGIDTNKNRILELKQGIDNTKELSNSQMKDLSKNNVEFSDSIGEGKDANIFIVTVPTPINNSKNPNLQPLLKASKEIGGVIKKGDIIIYESTVFPGATEDVCVPILERYSELKYNKDFFCGYSPERINPGDKKHTVKNITKVTSGSNEEIAKKIDDLYSAVIDAGTFKASSIKVAEAAKVIENSQRDINIAFINELSRIFSLMEIETKEVLDAASTKWNFLKFSPGLVGGHCIGVDPYYLAHKATELNYNPEIILAGRRINDSMAKHVVNSSIKIMISKNINVAKSNCLIMGITFKENCPDIRNSKVEDIYNELADFSSNIDVYDPIANTDEAFNEYKIKILNTENQLRKNYDLIIVAVPHDEFKNFELNKHVNKTNVIFDIKGLFPKEMSDKRL
tara:strand:- start:401 stop:1669 length:1269 start_codon:yes stop_codon:yes gene_type:complete